MMYLFKIYIICNVSLSVFSENWIESFGFGKSRSAVIKYIIKYTLMSLISKQALISKQGGQFSKFQ